MNLLLLLDISQVTDNGSHFPVSAVAVLVLGFVAAASIGSIAWFKSKREVGWKEDTKAEAQAKSKGSGEIKEEKSGNYDRAIIPAETGARMEREGDDFGKTPTEEEGDLDTTGGYTTTREGLINNYAVEPEMYAEERGDMEEQKQEDAEERKEELKDVNTDGGKGVGII